MAGMNLQGPGDLLASEVLSRFAPKYWEVNGDFLTAMSVVTTGSDSALATYVVRSNTSLPGLYFWISQGNVRDHARESYDTVYDWRGTTFQFRMVSDGVRPVMGALGAPGLTIVHTNGDQSIVDLAPYVIEGSGSDVTIRLIFSDTDPNRIKAGFPAADFDRSNIASMFFNVAVDEYQYGQCALASAYVSGASTMDVTSGNGLPFQIGDTIYIGDFNRTILNVTPISGDDYTLTLSSSIAQNIPDGSACYAVALSENAQAFDSEITASLTFSEIAISGPGSEIPLRHKVMPEMQLSQTDDYSFAKLVTPERIASENFTLGYRGLLNLYWSSTGFERLAWKTTDPIPGTYGYSQGGRWEVDGEDPRFNDAFRVWAADLLSRTDVILSQSMEILMHFMPSGWAQLDADGNRAASGYGDANDPLTKPWTNFIDPANEAAKAWVLGMAEDFKSLCDTAGKTFHPQLGEPNHWNGYDNAAKYGTWPKPCIYGEATIDQFAADQGFDLAGTIYSVTGEGRTITRSSGTFANVEPGMWVRTAGFAEGSNNGWWRVESVGDSTLTFADLARKDETATAVLDRGPGWSLANGPRVTSASFTVDATTNSITGPSFVWAYLEAGQEVQFSGFANEGNNDSWIMTSVSETTATFEPSRLGHGRRDETASATLNRGLDWDTELGSLTTTASFSVAASAHSITGPSYVWAYLVEGQEVSFSGFSNPGNNGTWIVSSVSEFVATFVPLTVGEMVDEAAGANVTLKRTPQRYINNSPALDFSEGSLDDVTLTSRRDLLSAFLVDIAEGYLSVGATDTRVLILPSNFLSDLGGMYNAMNRASAGLSPSVWTYAQWEPYDAEQTGNILLERQGFEVLRNDLGWVDFKRVEYFGGYVSLSFFATDDVPPLEVQWQRVTDFMAHAIPLFKRVYVWSRVQTIGGLDDGTTGHASWLPTDLTFRETGTRPVWFADAVGTSSTGSIVCARSGYRAPLRLKKTVGGVDYIRKYAPRDSDKERRY